MDFTRVSRIMFDLDGTVTDPAVGITSAVMHSLERMGIDVPPREELYKFIGPPLWDSYMRYYGLSRAEANQAVTYYREYYAVTGLFENEIYEGIPELLRDLADDGRAVILATSKPTVFSERILDHYGIRAPFSLVVGSELDGTRVNKDEVIRYILDSLPGKESAVMIGDRDYDVIGAKKNSLPAIGVMWGYGSREEFLNAGADAIAESVADLRAMLLG